MNRPLAALTTALIVGAGLLAGPASTPASSAPAPGPHHRPEPSQVVAIDWNRFDRGLPGDTAATQSAAILLNTNRYALQTWFPAQYGSQTGRYLDLGGVGEGSIRPPGSEALALATSVATGVYDPEVTGFSEQHARDVAIRLLTSIAYYHRVNSPNGWGNAWQSALWAYNAAFAGWLLWDDLAPDDRRLVERMVVAEADRFLHYEVPYYQAPDGTVITPGDTKAEENAWNAAFLNLAVAMMPRHPNRAVWQDKAIELMVSAYARPSDLSSDVEVNGKPVADWLNGSNIFDDGTLVNHGFIHPDYFTSIANSVGAPTVYGLAGMPTPRAAFFNADLVYDTLVDHEFPSPPYDAPGGTIYRRDADGRATSEIYYPQGNDWGTHRRMHVALLDTLADTFGLDARASVPAADWAAAHASQVLAMQSRFDDGRTYGAPSEDTYSGREQWVALLAARTYLTHWLDHNTDLRVTNRAYPVRPADYPGGELTLDAPASLPLGRATPVTVRVRSTSDAPLKGLSMELSLPDGWTAQLRDGPARGVTVAPGGTAEATWLVTPEPGSLERTERIEATARYRHHGRPRLLEATGFGYVTPGVNVALDKPVTVSSMLRPDSGGEKAVDGRFTDDSRWISAEDDPAPVLTVDLGAPTPIDSIDVYSGYQTTNHDPTTTLKDFAVEVRTADGWRTVAEITGNVDHRVTVRDLDVSGDAVRLSISDPSGSTIDVARVFEVEVYQAATA